MPSKPIHTEIDGHSLKLTNLDKVIYPSEGIVKAEIINYYLENSDLLLNHLKGRPLTLIRWPDGVEGKKFYSKNKPKWTPDWILSQKLPNSEDDNSYVIANNKATLGWLANLAALELHPMGSRIPALDKPDHMIFDLDPLSEKEFSQIKEVAFLLKEYLEAHDYVPFIKTSGSKGLHIYIPILANWTFKELVESLKKFCQTFIKEKAPFCTLAVHKGKRKGKVLLDIYRNYQGNTCVAPYSLRGKSGAPISAPISWESLESLESSRQYTLRNINDHLSKGNPWEKYFESARPLHNYSDRSSITPINVPTDQLSQYKEKRDFSKTAEPAPKIPVETKQRFVIQLHDATNLHYDLRLESEGVLLSWAIPKALPIKKDKPRLAIRTEDHPVKYLNFEGVIPKGEYGGGEMWIIETGSFEWIDKKEDKIKFRLKGDKYQAAYNLFQTKNNQWLCKTLEPPKTDLYDKVHSPMLANARKTVPKSSHYQYEIKWDGIRVLVYVQGDELKIYSRSGRDISKHFPELTEARKEFEIESGIFDGEIVVLDKSGKPIFSEAISRMHTIGESSIKQLSKSKKSTCYIFDTLIVDGHEMLNKAQEKRHGILRAIIPRLNSFRVSEAFTDGEGLFQQIKKAGMEGIMAKDKRAAYSIDQRSDAWLKIKVRHDIRASVIGYTQGEGDRSGLIGALHLVDLKEGSMKYLGKVGTGFTHAILKGIMEKIKDLPRTKKPIKEDIEEAKRTVWIEPKFMCNIEYASKTNKGTLREPVWKGWVE